MFSDHLAGTAGAPGARPAWKLPARPAEIALNGGGGDGAVLETAALRAGILLVQPPQVGWLPVPGIGRAHQFSFPDHFGGDHIVYCGDYLNVEHEFFQLSRGRAPGAFSARLSAHQPPVYPDWVQETWLFRHNLRPAIRS